MPGIEAGRDPLQRDEANKPPILPGPRPADDRGPSVLRAGRPAAARGTRPHPRGRQPRLLHLGPDPGSGARRSPMASFWRKLSRGRRRWWRAVAGTDLHRLPHIADDAAQTVVHRLGCPVASGSVHRLGVTGIHNVAWRPGGNDRAGDHGAADDPCRDPWCTYKPTSKAKPAHL
jgi:hypothetical protein